MTKINHDRVAPKEVAAIVRSALRPRYGHRHVRVTCESGTAYGWIDARIEIVRPSECFCAPGSTYCGRCREALNTAAAEARKIVYEAMRKAGAEFGTFTSDDGYNTQSDEFILAASFINT